MKQANSAAQTNVGIDSLTGEVKDIATSGYTSNEGMATHLAFAFLQAYCEGLK